MQFTIGSNPFSVVVLTALLAILYKNIRDEHQKDIKHDLYDEMMKRNVEKKKLLLSL